MLTSSDEETTEVTDSSISAFAQDDIYLGRAPAVDSSVTFDHVKNANYPRDMPFEGTETSIASDDWHFNRPTLPAHAAPPLPNPSSSREVHQRAAGTTKR